LQQYFLVAIRHLKRQPGYAGLNILGLTIGIASALLIILYLKQELSYDKHHEHADLVYRISSDIREPDDAFRWSSTQAPLGKTVALEIQEVDQFCRFVDAGNTRLRHGDNDYFAEDMYLVDSTVFSLFTVNFLQGDKETALDAPNSIVLSKSFADRIFKGQNPLGELLQTDNQSYKVTGVYEDMPNASHLIADGMASFSTIQNYYNSQSFGSFGLYTYIKLNPTATPEIVETRLNEEIIPKYVATIFDQFNIKIQYELLNIADIHLYSDFLGEARPLGNIDYIYIFSAVAVFLIIIACINYMNLATARSMRRSLEVGIRKVMGALRGALIRQFIVESILIAVAAIFISLLLLLIIVPILNSQVGTNLLLSDILSSEILFSILGILIITGLASGSYPAFYLSGFTPIKALKGGAGSKRTGNVWLRRVLVGIQFSVSIFMLVGTFIIYQQMNYVQSADMGFDKDQIVRLRLNERGQEKWQALRNELLSSPFISKASTSTNVPGSGVGKNVMQVETNEGVLDTYGVDWYGIDYDYADVLNLEMVEGRNFSRQYPTDTSNAVLVNESMVQRLGWDNPIGKRFQFDNDSTVFHRVIGVVKDFHQQSLYNPIQPLMFSPMVNNSQALIKVEGDFEAGLNHIESSWMTVIPDLPFEYEMLDQNFLEEYEEDQLRGKFFLGFALMMIIISGLGLLGLASFTAEQRRKEISVRKVLGANVVGLILLLVRDFIVLVAIGALPAFLISYKIMNRWLENFQYHIDIAFYVYLVVLLITAFFVVATTGWQAFKAASVNPSKNLKYE
ncbi:MAG: ABC transporter permease, partial [Ekhidna sp.]|nr:ABC transporter permease [Ekhidna sp.]